MAKYTVAFLAVNGKTNPDTGRPEIIKILDQDADTLFEAGQYANNYVRTPATRRVADLFLSNKLGGNTNGARFVGVGVEHPDGTIDMVKDFDAVRLPYVQPVKKPAVSPLRLAAEWVKGLFGGNPQPTPAGATAKTQARSMEVA